jgi:hypothetical protein
MCGAFAAHPGGEPFVEPEVVPPCHGHEIAEPHMRHLMGQHFINILLRFSRGILRIEEKHRFEIGDSTPVLHRAAEPAGQSNLIQLRQWIRHAEIIVVVLQNLGRSFERIPTKFRFAFCCNHTDLRRAGSRFD